MTNTFEILPQPSGQSSHQCWSCGDMRAALFCDSCGSLQPAAPTDYFTFFGWPRKLNLEMPALEREYYRLSRLLHPDLFANTTTQEQTWSLQKTSHLNDAYRTLRDPILRTEYLLRLQGLQVHEKPAGASLAAAAMGESKKGASSELLEEAFELNMQLEELQMNHKMGEHDEDLERQLAEQESALVAKLAQLDGELHQQWNQWDALANTDGLPASKILDSMVELLSRRSYLRNLVRDVKEALAD